MLHAPRQTGKTSALLGLCDLLNRQGYACLYTTVETARTARDDVGEAMLVVLSEPPWESRGICLSRAAVAGSCSWLR